ncbi:reverse transcriptase domain-containing protein [Tanacetum coccineum]
METRGRKKSVAELAPPARDPRDVETIEREKPRYVNHLFKPRRNDHDVDRDDRYRDDPICSLGLKIKIPKFMGKVHPDDFIDWLSTVERVFDVRDIPDKLKVKLVAIKLRQHASLWWDHVNKRRRIEGKSKVETWETMKKLIKAKFLPENHRQEAFLDYHNLSQQNMNVEEVINEFDKLHMRCNVVEEEEQVVTRFLGVLMLEIANTIKAKSKGSTSRFTPPTRTAPLTTPKTTPKATTPQPRLQVILENVLTMTLVVKSPIYDIDAEPKLDEPGDELVYPDCGEALVIQRVLNVAASKYVDDNSWLRFYWKTKHDGFQNTYNFKKDGVNITLVPFDSRPTQAEGSNLFMKKTDFEALMKTSPYVFTLVVVEENDYMWHGRPNNANWAMVSCYFVQILLQNSTPLFYANGDKYATPWSDVDQVIVYYSGIY